MRDSNDRWRCLPQGGVLRGSERLIDTPATEVPWEAEIVDQCPFWIFFPSAFSRK